MIRSISIFVFAIIILSSCKTEPKLLANPYINDMQLRPSYLAVLDTANYTTIEFVNKEINVGDVKMGDSAHVVFAFKNTGKKLLFIDQVIPSCGCTAAAIPIEPVQPGESDVIKLTYNSKGQHAGPMHKDITVTSNTQNGTKHHLTITGNQLP